MGPGGSRGLQSRCEARRTSWVCSIRTRLRQNDRSPFSRKRGRGFSISGRTLLPRARNRATRDRAGRSITSQPLLPRPSPARPHNRAAARSRRSQYLLKPSSASRRIDRRSALSLRAFPVSLRGFCISLYYALFYVFRYILCDYRDYLTSFYNEREFAWI